MRIGQRLDGLVGKLVEEGRGEVIRRARLIVQLVCAWAYLEYRTNNLAELHIHVGVLPDHVRRGLLRTAELNRALEPVSHLLEATHIFTPTGLSLDSLPGSAQISTIPSVETWGYSAAVDWKKMKSTGCSTLIYSTIFNVLRTRWAPQGMPLLTWSMNA